MTLTVQDFCVSDTGLIHFPNLLKVVFGQASFQYIKFKATFSSCIFVDCKQAFEGENSK